MARATSRGAVPDDWRGTSHKVAREQRVRTLMRVHADHHHRHDLPLPSIHARWDRGGHALLQIGQRRTSYEPRHGKVQQGGTSFESQAVTSRQRI
jgi:hypothetical protein